MATAPTDPNRAHRVDDLTFFSLLAVLQSGMWLLNDIESFLREFNISYGRFSILVSALDLREPPPQPNELADMLGKSRPTITRMIARLESDGLVSVQQDPSDGRAKRLSLTKLGQELLDVVIPKYNTHILAIAEALSETDKRQVLHLLAKLHFISPDRKIRRPQ